MRSIYALQPLCTLKSCWTQDVVLLSSDAIQRLLYIHRQANHYAMLVFGAPATLLHGSSCTLCML